MATPSTHAEAHGSGRRRRIAALALVLAVVVVAVPLAVRLMSSDDPAVVTPGDPPTVVSPAELRRFADDGGQPVYWAGERAGARLELTGTASRNVFVRYLTGTAAAGVRSPAYVTVGTYPKADAYATVRRQSGKAKARKAAVPGGGLAVWNPASRSVYVGYPGVASLVEVYAPAGGQAVRLVRDGAIVRVR